MLWLPLGGEIISSDDGNTCAFGSSLALTDDGYGVVIGNPCYTGKTNGTVEVFRWQDQDNSDFYPYYQWKPVGVIRGSLWAFGSMVSISAAAKRIAVATPGYFDISGDPLSPDIVMTSDSMLQVYNYNQNHGEWEPLGENLVAASNAASDYMTCNSLAMSKDGNTVVVGGRVQVNMNPGGPEPTTPIFLGHTRVYRYDQSKLTWDKIGPDLECLSPTDPFFSNSLAVSEDGSLIAYSGVFTAEEASRRSKNHDGWMYYDSPYVAVATLTKTGFAKRHIKWKQVGIPLQTYPKTNNLFVALELSLDGCVLAAGDMNRLHAWKQPKCSIKHSPSGDNDFAPSKQGNLRKDMTTQLR